MPRRATIPSAAARDGPPADSRMRSNSPSDGIPTATCAAPRRSRSLPRSALRTTAVTSAPSWAASWTAKRPTPPDAPVMSTRWSGMRPPACRARRAVRPATGRVAARPGSSPSGISAMCSVGTAARSAQPPPRPRATTAAPVAGPLPSSAGVTTTPATSEPGRRPSSAEPRERTSNGLRETADTATKASVRSGRGSSTSRISTPPRPSATSALIDRALVRRPWSLPTGREQHAPAWRRRQTEASTLATPPQVG